MILGIDPGITFGWAEYDEVNKELVRHGVVKNVKGEWVERIQKLHQSVIDVLDKSVLGIDVVVIEYPQFFDTGGGRMVARRGDLGKLFETVGVIEASVMVRGYYVVHAPVISWKGQLPKKVVNERIERILGRMPCRKLSTHDWDAVGIALWYAGEF